MIQNSNFLLPLQFSEFYFQSNANIVILVSNDEDGDDDIFDVLLTSLKLSIGSLDSSESTFFLYKVTLVIAETYNKVFVRIPLPQAVSSCFC